MGLSIPYSVLVFAIGALEHYAAVLLLGFAVALLAVYVNLSGRISALQRQLLLEGQRAGSEVVQHTTQNEQRVADLASAATAAGLALGDAAAASNSDVAQQAVSPKQAHAASQAPSDVHSTEGIVTAAAGDRRSSIRPDDDAQAAGFIARWFASGNWLVRSGIVVLFLGVGFLLKFAADHSLLPIELRLAGVGIAGISLVFLGLKLTASRRAYALALQGGGVGLIYLTLYAAFALYALVNAVSAFSMMLFVVLAAGCLAHRQDAQVLAVIGAIGGFAAPILASTGSGNHLLLFTYYALLNVGVLGLALNNTWRVLNVSGFVATFVISALWGYQFYDAAHFATVEPFLALFFAMYLSIAIAFATLRSLRLQDPLDSTLVFGTPLVVFGLQSKLLADTDYGLAWCAVIFAIVYALAAWFVLRRAGERLRVLAQAFAALAIGFATLAIPLAFDARWSSASWALEGAALVWVGWRQGRLLARIAGSVLQLIAGAAWLWHGLIMTEWLVSDWLGTVMLASAGLLSSRVLSLPADDAEGPPGARFLSIALGVWGLLWWFGAGAAQIVVTASSASTLGALLLLVAISALCLEWLGARLPWAFARAAVCCLPALLVILAIGSALSVNHPFTSLAALAWPCALCALIFILRLRKEQRGALTDSAHLLVLWLTTALVSWEFARLCGRWIAPLESWLEATWLLIPSVSVACLLIAKRRGTWPLAARHRLYLHFGALPVLFTLAIGVLWLSVRAPGAAWPIPYMPLLNPVDLLSVAALAVMLMWWRACEEINGAGLQAGMAIAGLVLSFVWLNAALLRSLYFWAGVPYELSVQMNSTLVQASLSVLWASTALLAMLAGSRASERAVWMSGVSLMAVVVAKLLLVDLASSGTIARIVSFIGVGLLMMLVGYLAPVPPRQVDVATA